MVNWVFEPNSPLTAVTLNILKAPSGIKPGGAFFIMASQVYKFARDYF